MQQNVYQDVLFLTIHYSSFLAASPAETILPQALPHSLTKLKSEMLLFISFIYVRPHVDMESLPTFTPVLGSSMAH